VDIDIVSRRECCDADTCTSGDTSLAVNQRIVPAVETVNRIVDSCFEDVVLVWTVWKHELVTSCRLFRPVGTEMVSTTAKRLRRTRGPLAGLTEMWFS